MPRKLSPLNQLLDAIAQNLPAEAFPTAGRVLLETAQGKKKKITESDFTADELAAMRRLIKSTGDKGYVTYRDYADIADKENSSAVPSVLSIFDPLGNVQTTLGRFKYSRDKDGNVVATDAYDFNPVETGGEVNAAWRLSPYGIIRQYAGEKIPPGEGRDVQINLGREGFAKGGALNIIRVIYGR